MKTNKTVKTEKKAPVACKITDINALIKLGKYVIREDKQLLKELSKY